MNEFNFRVANAAVFEIGQNVGDTKTTYIHSYKTKYINGKSTGQKTNVDWDLDIILSSPSWVSVKYAFEGNDCKVTFTTLQKNTGSSARTHTFVFKQRESGQTISFPIRQKAAEQEITLTIHWPLNTLSGAFFKEGQTPQTGSTGTTYFDFSVSSNTSVHKYKKSEGVRVNLQNGNTEMAYPGDRISAYRFTNKTWQLMSTFPLPSSDQTITL